MVMILLIGSTSFLLTLGLHLLKIFLCLTRNYLTHNVLEIFHLSPVAEAEVDKIITNFKDSAAGWDEFKPSIIKTVKDSIKIPLAHIGSLSFDTGIFPIELKIAIIVPISKSGDDCIFINYRPVSVLPVF